MLLIKAMWLFYTLVFVSALFVICIFITFVNDSSRHVTVDEQLLMTSGLHLPGIGAYHHRHDLEMRQGSIDPHHKMLVSFNKIVSEVEEEIKPRHPKLTKIKVINTRPNKTGGENMLKRTHDSVVPASSRQLSEVDSKRSMISKSTYSNSKSGALETKHKSIVLNQPNHIVSNEKQNAHSDEKAHESHVSNNIRSLKQLKSDTMDTTSGVRKGYVFAVNYYEQQTMASRNLFQLQCWAKHLDLAVVKPFTKQSLLGTPLDDKLQKSLLKFDDLFNLSDWKSRTEKAQFAPLVEWSEFITRASRDLILVQFNYASVSLLKERQKHGESVIHPHVSDRYKSGCDSKWPNEAEATYLKSKGFKTIRSVCFNFYYGDQLTMEEFDSHLFGGLSPQNVTIVMNMWRGLGSGQRILIKGMCTTMFPIQEFITPSDRLLKDAETYISTYLNREPYIAVMGRYEMTLLTIHKNVPVLPYCLEKTLAELEHLKREKHLDATFLSVDIGKYGSKKWRSKIDSEVSREFEQFFRGVYKELTIPEWEFTFENTTHVKDAGYIGLLQQIIVTQAKCILFVGGGAFQRHALHLYNDLHPIEIERCVRVVKSCTSPSKFQL